MPDFLEILPRRGCALYLQGTFSRGRPQTKKALALFTGRKRRTEAILRIAESEGVKVERKAKNYIPVP